MERLFATRDGTEHYAFEVGILVHLTTVTVSLVIVISNGGDFFVSGLPHRCGRFFRGITLLAVEDYFTVLMCFEALWLDVRRRGMPCVTLHHRFAFSQKAQVCFLFVRKKSWDSPANPNSF